MTTPGALGATKERDARWCYRGGVPTRIQLAAAFGVFGGEADLPMRGTATHTEGRSAWVFHGHGHLRTGSSTSGSKRTTTYPRAGTKCRPRNVHLPRTPCRHLRTKPSNSTTQQIQIRHTSCTQE
uniref:Uncharacterized protein n=1 Tax=Rhodococcus sp. B264-1 TaxID=233067 RepID=Q7X2S9_9NOCA|nr:hypothetical protein [Rhodococcus sp. B264-1]